HKVYSTQKILSVVSVKVKKLHGYGHLEEIVVRRADRQMLTCGSFESRIWLVQGNVGDGLQTDESKISTE
ncbi:hypothetical protein Tco_1072228, partial [Tanacetum coccineum]